MSRSQPGRRFSCEHNDPVPSQDGYGRQPSGRHAVREAMAACYSAAISCGALRPSSLSCRGSPANRRNASAICTRPLTPVMTTSTMVKGRVEVAARLELLDRHTGGGQGFGVSDTLVAQRIELAGRHQCRWQALEFAAQRRDARIGAVGRRAIEVPEPVHQRARQEIAGRVFGVEGRSKVQSVTGQTRNWPEICGPPRSRASWQVTAAMLPPALQPATITGPGMPPSRPHARRSTSSPRSRPQPLPGSDVRAHADNRR